MGYLIAFGISLIITLGLKGASTYFYFGTHKIVSVLFSIITFWFIWNRVDANTISMQIILSSIFSMLFIFAITTFLDALYRAYDRYHLTTHGTIIIAVMVFIMMF